MRTGCALLCAVALAAQADAFSLGGARLPFATTAAQRSTCAIGRPGVSTWFSQRAVAQLRSAPGLRMQATVEQTNVAMPALSSTMTEGKIVQWTKQVGDKVSAGDILMVVESDKADMDVESFEDGYIAAILVDDGESAAVGATVAIIVPNEADIANVVIGDAAAPAAAAPAAEAPAAAPAGGAALPDCATAVFMPALSSTMTEGKIVQWTKSEGDKISAGDILMVVESDKADMDVESFEEGYLAKILVEDGDAAPVGSTVALLAATEADIPTVVAAAGSVGAAPAPAAAPAAAAAPAMSAPASAPAGAPRPAGDRVVASPMAKTLAAEKGINLADITGTGPDGRITASDVEAYKPGGAGAKAEKKKDEGPKIDRTGGGVIPSGTIIASPQAKKAAKKNKIDIKTVVGSGNFGRITEADVLAAAGKAPAAKQTFAAPTRDIPELPDGPVKMSGMQVAVANNMMATMIPPSYRVARKIQMDKFDELYAAMKPKGVTVSALVSRAVALALEKHPIINAHFDDATKSIVYHKDINIANAVALDGGLITPVIQNCNMKDITTVNNEWKELVGKAKAGKLAPAEFQSGTFSISNLGMFGVSQFGSLLPPGTGSILAIGGSQEVVKMKNGQPVAVKEMEVTITCDHRHIYGADAALFLKTLAEIMETDTLSIVL